MEDTKATQAASKALEGHDFTQSGDPVARREQRIWYRKGMEMLEKKHDEIVKDGTDMLSKILSEQNEQFKSVTQTRESVLDASMLGKVSRLGVERARNLRTTFAAFDPDKYDARLQEFMTQHTPGIDMEESDADFDWTKLGLAACSVHALPPHMTVMLGPLDLDTTKRVVKQAERRKKFSTEKTVPDEHVKAQISHEDITTMRIAEINTILERMFDREVDDDVCLYELTMNPKSYSQSLENLFHLAFLVKDNRAEVFMDEDGLPRVVHHPADEENGEATDDDNKEEEDASAKASKGRRQNVMGVSMQDWRDIIETFQIKKSIIPHREAIAEKDI